MFSLWERKFTVLFDFNWFITIILSLLSLILNIHGKIVHFFIPLGFFGASRTFFLSKKLTETDLSDGTTDPETVDFFLMVFKLWKLVPSLSDKSVPFSFGSEKVSVEVSALVFCVRREFKIYTYSFSS